MSEEDKFLELLISVVHRLTKQVEEFRYGKRKIGQGLFIIDYVGRNETADMTALSKFLHISPSTATRQVDRLVEIGFLERKPAEEDRRRILLQLSQRGKNLYKKFYEHRLRKLRPLLSALDKDEKAVLSKLLEAASSQL